MSGVYQITSLINGHRYIGSSVSLQKRRATHFSFLRKNRHTNAYLQRAYNLYGADNFEFKVLLLCDPENCIIYEQAYLDALQPEYNLLRTAGSSLGHVMSEKSRAKMGLAHVGNQVNLGRILTEETKRKISETKSGKTVGEETKRKMSNAQTGENNAFYGRHHTEETKLKMSESIKEVFRNRRAL